MRRALLLGCAVVALAACSAPAPAAGPAGGAQPGEAATAPPAPTRLSIPAIGVDSTLIRTGLLPDGSPQVPDVRTPGQASWATWSPEPGTVGPAVLLGHVDGEVAGRRGAPGVFARIDELRSGQEVLVDRADGSRVTFVVTRVESWPKDQFEVPLSDAQREVYGDVPGPELRLITCGGTFNGSARSYRDQVVAFARVRP